MTAVPKLSPALFDTPWIDTKTGKVTRSAQQNLQDFFTAVLGALTNLGQIKDTTPIQGRTEALALTVQNFNSVGVLQGPGADFTQPYLNKTTDNITDGTGSPLTGGKRGFIALDLNNKLPGASATPNMQLNAVNFATVQGVDLGGSAGILIYGPGGAGTSWTAQVGTTTVGPFPSGSLSGLAYSTQYVVYYDTINAVYVAATTIPSGLNDYFQYAGTVTTPASGGVSGATGTAVMGGSGAAQFVSAVNITAAGSGYSTAPTVSFSGGGTPSTPAAGYATISGGHVTGVVMTNTGAGYSSGPTVSFSGGSSGSNGGGGSTGGVGGKGALAGANLGA